MTNNIHTNMYLGGRKKPDFVAILNYMTSEQGGRKTAAHSKYRPLIEFPGLLPLTSGEQIFLDRQFVNPGETVNAEITIVSVDDFKNKLFVGQSFIVCEIPGHTLATGEIVKIVNGDLDRNNASS
jgi:hypothetical protein